MMKLNPIICEPDRAPRYVKAAKIYFTRFTFAALTMSRTSFSNVGAW